MVVLRIFIIIIVVTLLFSCNNFKNQKTVFKKKIVFESEIDWRVMGAKVKPDFANKKIKIIASINANCSHCVEKMIYWNSFICKIDTSDVGLFCIVESNDNYVNFESFIKNIPFEYPVIYDHANQIMIYNKIEKFKDEIFILDSTNLIIFSGNIIDSQKLELEMLKIINYYSNY